MAELLQDASNSLEFPQLPLELISQIMERCTSKELILFRLVNFDFKILATRVLQRRLDVQIIFDFGSDLSIYGWSSLTWDKFNRLNNYLKYLKTLEQLTDFPFVNFKFCHVDLAKLEIQTFFQIYGNFVKSLSLYNCKSLGDSLPLKNILQNLAPNISNFELTAYRVRQGRDKEIERGDSANILFSNNFVLPNLKTFKFNGEGDDIKFGREILKVAVNLKKFINFGPYTGLTCGDFVEVGKIKTIKNLSVDSLNGKNIEFYENLAGANLKLKNLKILFKNFDSTDNNENDLNLFERSMWVVLNVMESSKNFLKSLEINGFNLNNCAIPIPICHQIEQLTLDNYHVTPATIQKLGESCQNVQSLIISGKINFKDVCPIIFKYYKQLKSLQLYFSMGQCHSHHLIDMTFCGFDLSTCQKLDQMSAQLDDSDVEHLRNTLSILELENLTALKINLTDINLIENVVLDQVKILTKVSKWYVFDKLPDLRVSLMAGNYKNEKQRRDMKTIFEKLSPFVHSVPSS